MTSKECDVACRYRALAHATMALFIIGMVVGITVSFYATDYTPDNDKIQNFYDTFHPCILIDHYPMSVIAAVVLGVGIFVSLAWFFTAFMQTLILGSKQTIIGAAFLLTFCALMELAFINVFTAGMYTLGDGHGDLPPGQKIVLTEDDNRRVAIHSFFYCLNLVSTLCQMQFLTSQWENFFGMAKLGPKMHAFWILNWTLGIVAVIQGIAFMAAGIVNGNMDWTKNPTSFIQTAVIWTNDNMKMSNWGWISTKLFRYATPKEAGVNLKFSLTKSKNNSLAGSPEYLLEVALRMLFLLLIGTYVCENPSDIDASAGAQATLFPLAAGFRRDPWNYLFAPTWILINVLVLSMVWLTCIRSTLRNEGEATTPRMWAERLIGAILSITCFSCVCIVVPMWTGSAVPTFIFMISYILWIPTSAGFNVRSIIYVVGFIVLLAIVLSISDGKAAAWANLALLVWAMGITSILPVQPPMYVEITNLEGTDLPVKKRFYPCFKYCYSGYNEYDDDEAADKTGDKEEPVKEEMVQLNA